MTDNWKEITDPEELFKLKRDGWEIEVKYSILEEWLPWDGKGWTIHWKFHARPRQLKMKKVKVLCWLSTDDAGLHWVIDGTDWPIGYTRVPSQDIEIEVPDEMV